MVGCEAITRRRNRYFYDARDSFYCIERSMKNSLGMWCPDFKRLENVKTWFECWMEHYNVGQYAVLQGEKDFVFVRQITRFMPLYKRRLWMRFGFLDKVVFQHHLVLEVNPEGFIWMVDAYGFINKMWARLRANLFKKYGKFQSSAIWGKFYPGTYLLSPDELAALKATE